MSDRILLPTDAKHSPDQVVAHNKRTYRVAPSQFGGFSVVEIITSKDLRPIRTLRPVRNLRERDAVIAKATGANA